MQLKIKLNIFILIIFYVFSFNLNIVLAQGPGGGGGGPAGGTVIESPLFCNDVFDCITKILVFVRDKIGIPLAVIAIVYAGFRFLYAQGKPEEIKKARSILMWTLIGVALIVASEAIAKYIEKVLREGP